MHLCLQEQVLMCLVLLQETLPLFFHWRLKMGRLFFNDLIRLGDLGSLVGNMFLKLLCMLLLCLKLRFILLLVMKIFRFCKKKLSFFWFCECVLLDLVVDLFILQCWVELNYWIFELFLFWLVLHTNWLLKCGTEIDWQW